MYEYKYRKIFYVLFFLTLVSVDQAVKYIIRSSGGFYICNKHFAFGLTIIEIVAIVAVLFFMAVFNLKSIPNFKFRISNFTLFKIAGIILIISGAISNVIDRLAFGCVIDFIDLPFWPVFNLADIYITIGSVVIIGALVRKD